MKKKISLIQLRMKWGQAGLTNKVLQIYTDISTKASLEKQWVPHV